MNSLPIALGVMGLITSAITIATFLWKAMNAISNLKTSHAALRFEIDRVELTMNGVRERMEHINTRLSGQWTEADKAIEDLQGYLQKHTSYERRGNR